MNLYLSIALAMALAFGWFEMKQAEDIENAFESFKASQAVLAAEQEKRIKIEEARHVEQVKTALIERDVLLGKLRDAERTRPNILSRTTQAAGGSSKVCFDKSTADAAIRRFTEDARRLVIEGDSALIDNKTWLESWPR